MTEEEKRKKKQKIEENRAKKITGEAGQEGDEGENSQSSINIISSNNDHDNSDSNNNESEGNDVPVSLPTPVTSAPPLPAKPQAVVVGVIREGDSLPHKVRLDSNTRSTILISGGNECACGCSCVSWVSLSMLSPYFVPIKFSQAFLYCIMNI